MRFLYFVSRHLALRVLIFNCTIFCSFAFGNIGRLFLIARRFLLDRSCACEIARSSRCDDVCREAHGSWVFLFLITLIKKPFLRILEVKMDVAFIGQLVDSMDSAVLQLEQAVAKDQKDQANKLKTFIFDLHNQIERAIVGENV